MGQFWHELIKTWRNHWVPLHYITKLALQKLREKTLFQSGNSSQQIDVTFLCVCPRIDEKLRHNIVKVESQASGSAANFDNVMTKFIINKRADALKADVNLFLFLFFCNNKTHTCQPPEYENLGTSR